MVEGVFVGRNQNAKQGGGSMSIEARLLKFVEVWTEYTECEEPLRRRELRRALHTQYEDYITPHQCIELDLAGMTKLRCVNFEEECLGLIRETHGVDQARFMLYYLRYAAACQAGKVAEAVGHVHHYETEMYNLKKDQMRAKKSRKRE